MIEGLTAAGREDRLARIAYGYSMAALVGCFSGGCAVIDLPEEISIEGDSEIIK